MKKILVTGSSGFLGSRLVRYLRQFSKYKIYTLDLRGSPKILGDLSVARFVNSLPDFDVIIHCAAVQYVTDKKPFFFRKKWFYLNNVKATENLINRYKNSNTFFIHIGTSMQYYQDGKKYYQTTSQMLSQGLYSWSKLLAQNVVDNSGIRSATIIPCIIGGKGREGLFKGFVNTIKNWKIAFIPGQGNYKISIVHVNDVVRLISLVLEKKVSGYFNAASEDASSIIDWVNFIQKSLKIKTINIIHLPYLPLYILSKILCFRVLAEEQLVMLKMSHVLNIDKSKDIGWKPKYKSRDIVDDIASYISDIK